MVTIREGFALLGIAGQNFERVRTFGIDSRRVRAFGRGLAKNLEGFALLGICLRGFGDFLRFPAWARRVSVF